MATFSFFGNKLFTSGEGGALSLNDDQLATRIRILRGQGMDPDRRYYFPVTGYNFRLTNLAAAILCAQLERRDAIIARRREIFALYNRLLSQVPGIGLQPIALWAELSPWMYCVTVDDDQFGGTRDDLAAKLTEAGIDSRPMFIPLHSLPPFREESRQRGEHLPITDSLSQSSIMLPTFTQLTNDQVTDICGEISDACRNRVGISQFRRAA